jgi:aspartyl-tRNA(Asn)/glutamyl-tRNA(Gln) amidotransferase subunit A
LYASVSRAIVRGAANHQARTSRHQARFGQQSDAKASETEKAMPNNPTLASTLASLADDLDSGRTTARKLVDQCLAKIADASGEGIRTFIHVDKEAAIEAAEAMDRLRDVKAAPSPFAGIPISIKDLFDIKGQVTRAGSRALDDSPPAEADAPVVSRLRRAGFIVIGRTNMTEFAYSGIGINPHYGTPKGAWNRSAGHVPGGSSSGAAVSVVDGMAHGALGTDTGGSCRIPAAFNGIVGYKPTQRRVPLDGGVPLSFSLDSFGPLARTVACCAVLDAVLANETFVPLQPRPIKGMRLAVPTTVALDDLDDAVAQTFERALQTLSRQGALIERIEVPEFLDIAPMNAKGGFAAAESYAWHRYLITSKGNLYDPRVASRILRGESQSAADYIDLLGARRSLIARTEKRLAPYDALVLPTTANTPPRIADLADDKAFTTENLRALRNCTLINMIDGCAISLPAHREGEVPVGLMLAASGGSDRRIFELAAAMEAVIRV